MTSHLSPQHQNTGFLACTAPSRTIRVEEEALLHHETSWLTRKPMARLIGAGGPANSRAFKNTFESNKLGPAVVCSFLEHTTGHDAGAVPSTGADASGVENQQPRGSAHWTVAIRMEAVR